MTKPITVLPRNVHLQGEAPPMSLRYVIHPVGMQNYRWAGPTVGFSFYVQDLAIQYVSESVARQAVEVVQALHADFPRARDLTYRAIEVPD